MRACAVAKRCKTGNNRDVAALRGRRHYSNFKAMPAPLFVPKMDPRNHWGVDILDVEPVTSRLVSTVKTKEGALKFSQLLNSTGEEYRNAEPVSSDLVLTEPRGTCSTVDDAKRRTDRFELPLVYKTDGKVAEGVLFQPETMEDKFALYFFDHKIIVVRTLSQTVVSVAHVEQEEDESVLSVVRIDGGPMGTVEEDTELHAFDFLVKTHVMGVSDYPLRLPRKLAADFDSFSSSEVQKDGTKQAKLREKMNDMGLFAFGFAGRNVRNVCRKTPPSNLPCDAHTGRYKSPFRSHSLLHMACIGGSAEMVDHFLRREPYAARAGSVYGGTRPLHFAMYAQETETQQQRNTRKDIAKMLLEFGGDVNAQDDEGTTPLFLTAQCNDKDFAKHLLDLGAEVNTAREGGFTPLHVAAEMGHAEVVQVLLENGAETSTIARADSTEYTPAGLAEKQGHKDVVAMLKKS